MKIPFTGDFYTSRSKYSNAQECINWYPETDPTGKNQLVLYPRPGKTQYIQVGVGPIRGMHVATFSGVEYLYVVSGTEVYEVQSSAISTLLGTISTNSGPVSMCSNRDEVLIVDGVLGHTYVKSTSTFASIADADFPDTATSCVFFDGFGLVNDPSNTDRFYKSASYDFSTWTATGFATAERAPDVLRTIVVNHRNMYLIGDKTTEVWYNAGSGTFSFAPIPNGLRETGTAAKYSVAKSDTSTIWLTRDERGHGEIISAEGINFQKISTYAIDEAISGYSKIDDAIGTTYQYKGHDFYEITFPTAGATWVYDITERKWHRQKTYGIGRHGVQHSAFFDSKILIGDYATGKVYYLDASAYTDDGTTIERIRASQYIHSDTDQDIRYNAVKLLMEMGAGDLVTTDPQVALEWSDDYGHTWSNKHYRSMGKIGEYGNEIVYRRLGRAETRLYRITVTDPVSAVLVGAYAEVLQQEKDRG